MVTRTHSSVIIKPDLDSTLGSEFPVNNLGEIELRSESDVVSFSALRALSPCQRRRFSTVDWLP